MKQLKIFALLTLTLLFMSGAWLMDIGHSSMVLNADGGNYMARTLTLLIDANTAYHTGLILCMLCFYLLATMFIFEVLREYFV